MIQNAAFRRKVVYLGLIALLLIPLYVVGHPAVGNPQDPNASPGGQLAQLRAEYDLSPAELGDIDPTSESMKLATLGMRGVAATILWSKANDYKKENWEGLVAVVNQMAKLQPNFLSVWEFQSHNLTYNTSVEMDDYRFRYLWVKKGIEFLIQGTHYNRREPKLFWTVGWYTGQKINRADESKQFRRLFRADQDFHKVHGNYVDVDGLGRGADGKPDSWLVSRLWYNRAYDLVDTQARPLRGKSPHIFYADGPKALMNYAGAIEDEGTLDEHAEYAWKRAYDEWIRFGERQVPTTNGLLIRLNDQEKATADAAKFTKELDTLAPGARAAIRDEKIAKLPPRQREVLDKPFSELSDAKDYELKYDGQAKVAVTDAEVADRAPSNVRAKAHRLAQLVVENATLADWIDRYRENVNFDYWRTRCSIEQLSQTVEARRHIFKATQLKDKVELDAARAEYEKAWDLWAELIAANPTLIESLTADDLLEYVTAYIKLLSDLDQKLPADFKLRPLLERHNKLPIATSDVTPSTSPSTATDASKPVEKSAEPAKPAGDVSAKKDEEKKPAAEEKKGETAKPVDEVKKPDDSKKPEEKADEKKPAAEEKKAEEATKPDDSKKPEEKKADDTKSGESKPADAKAADGGTSEIQDPLRSP